MKDCECIYEGSGSFRYCPLHGAASDLLAACEAAKLAFRELAEAAGDVPEWNEGGVAYEASQLVKRAVEKAKGQQ